MLAHFPAFQFEITIFIFNDLFFVTFLEIQYVMSVHIYETNILTYDYLYF